MSANPQTNVIMCLCTQTSNRINLVCCNCRYSRKGNREFKQKEVCPNCRSKLKDIGSKVAIPTLLVRIVASIIK